MRTSATSYPILVALHEAEVFELRASALSERQVRQLGDIMETLAERLAATATSPPSTNS